MVQEPEDEMPWIYVDVFENTKEFEAWHQFNLDVNLNKAEVIFLSFEESIGMQISKIELTKTVCY
jgi:hypothetical protein